MEKFIQENLGQNLHHIIDNYNHLNNVKLYNQRIKFPYNMLGANVKITYKETYLKYDTEKNILIEEGKAVKINNQTKGGTSPNVLVFMF